MIEYRQKFPFEFVIMLGDNLYDDDGAARAITKASSSGPTSPCSMRA